MKVTLRFFGFFVAGLMIVPSVGAQNDAAIVLAEQDGITVTTRDVAAELWGIDESAQAEILKNPEAHLRPIILQALTRKKMAAVAKEKGYLNEPNVASQLRRIEEDWLAQLVVEREMSAVVIPDQTEAAMTYYEANQQEFMEPATVQLQQIMLKASDESDRQKRLPEMQKILDKLTSGVDFPELAAQYSEDATKTTRGNLGWVQKGRLIPEVEVVAFKLKAGEVSEIVQSPYGLHLLKVLKRADERVRPFAAVKDDLIAMEKNNYLKKYMHDWVAKEAPDSAVFSDEAIKAAMPRINKLIAKQPD